MSPASALAKGASLARRIAWRGAGHRARCARGNATTSAASDTKSSRSRMSSWRLHSYSGISGLSLDSDLSVPHITAPDEVLVWGEKWRKNRISL